MGSDVLIRPATQADTGQILDLVKLSLGEGRIPRHIAYWGWKHGSNPFGPSPCLVAESDGHLVGLRAFMRWNWRARGATVPSVRAVDTATHPDWRGQGIFSRLTLALLEWVKAEGVAFVFNTPNKQSRPGYLKMGWVSLGRTSFWVRPLQPLQMIRSLLSSRPSERSLGDADAGAGCSSARELVEQPALSRLLDALAQREDRLATPRSREYLHWRYVAIPGFAYRAVWSLDRDDGAVIIFRSKTQGPLRELRLCEVLVGQTAASREMGQDLLRSLVRGAAAHYATGMAVPGTPAQRVLLQSGFLPAPRMGPVMTVRPLNGVTSGLDPLRRSSWRLSAGDLELF